LIVAMGKEGSQPPPIDDAPELGPHALVFSVLAPAKLNLFLRILGRRPDGYHLIDSSMVPISLYDRVNLTFVPGARLAVRCRGLQDEVPVDGDNLAGRAALLFMRETGLVGDVSITIDKNIPMGAGLGGGSSDAAAVLRMMAYGTGKDVPLGQLAQWAVTLGADVPFFVHGTAARVGGIGDCVEQVAPLLSMPIVVAFPGSGVSTADVYRAYDDSLTSSPDLSSGSVFVSDQRSLRETLVNDLEVAAMSICPPVRSLKQRMHELGAVGALMTGSGSAVFGIWDDGLAAEAAVRTLVGDGLWARHVEVIQRTPEIAVGDSRFGELD
jgi:4-diphosphocytidyl-2-C-methyl-D-erythritol kinase